MEQPEEAAPGAEVRVAGFADRVVAFTIDYALFVAGFFLSLKLFYPQFSVRINPHGMAWAAIWAVLYLTYQAIASSEGRVTIGKRLLGLRVVDLDGNPLTVWSAALRSVGYLLSSIFGVGFLWMLSNRAGQGWHDLLVGSGVIETRPRSPHHRSWVRAGAMGCLLGFSGLWAWDYLLAADYYRNMTLAYSHVGLEELGQLQDAYHRRTGRYADNILSLAAVSGDPDVFMRDMVDLFDPEAGIKIRLTANGYKIKAVSTDARHTPVSYSGPKTGRPSQRST